MNYTKKNIFYSVCDDLSHNFMPQFLFRLRRDIKQEILCLIALPKTSKFVKNTPLCVILLTLFRCLEIIMVIDSLLCSLYWIICMLDSSIKDVCANCFCASLLRMTAHANSHAMSCIECARQVLKWTMIGQMAIAIALLGFNDLRRSVTPTFLFRKRLNLQLSPRCSKMNKKSMWEVKKKIKISVHGK